MFLYLGALCLWIIVVVYVGCVCLLWFMFPLLSFGGVHVALFCWISVCWWLIL